MKTGTKIGIGIVGLSALGYFLWKNQGCFEGETKTVGCNQCTCIRNDWTCTRMACADTFQRVELIEDERRRI